MRSFCKCVFRLDAIRAGVVAIATVVAGALLLAAPVALAAGADSWTPWTPMPQDTWIRSLDFTAASTLLASSDGDGIFQAAATLGPWAQTNDGLTNPEDLKAFQVVASGGKLYAATSGGLFTAPQGGGTWQQHVGHGRDPVGGGQLTEHDRRRGGRSGKPGRLHNLGWRHHVEARVGNAGR